MKDQNNLNQHANSSYNGENLETSKGFDSQSVSDLKDKFYNGTRGTVNAAKKTVNVAKKTADVAKKTTRATQKAVKTTAKAARAAIRTAVKAAKLLAQAAMKMITFLISNPFVLLAIALIVLIIVIVVIVINFFKNDTTMSSIKNNSSEIVESWDENNLTDQQKAAKNSYEKSGSLLDFSINDIANMTNNLKDEYSKVDSNSQEKDVYKALLTECGSNMVSGNSRVVSPDDKVSLYEHIMLISKYDFNNVKWKHYGHGYDGSDSPLKEDTDLGVKYPSDQNNTKYETFSTLLRPYLLSYEIPASFFAGLLSEEDDKSIETTYAIIKHALSDITVNRYDIEKYTLRTYYLDYDYTEYVSTFNVTFTPQNDGTYKISYGSVSPTFVGDGHVNTTQDENGVSSPLRETVIPEQSGSTYQNKYYISQANIFDLKISTEFEYIMYSQNDVDNRVNEDSLETTDELYNCIENEQNKISNVIGGRSKCTSLEIEQVANLIASENNSSKSAPKSGNNGAITYTFTGNGTYEERNGTKFYVTRTWEDRLTQKEKKEEYYEKEDVIKFNETLSDGAISESNFSEDKTSDEYYKDLAERKKLNRIDLINSNPDIYKLYTSDPYAKYIGINREDLEPLCYNTLKKNWEDLQKTYKTFPYMYGKTYGFIGSSSSSSNYLSGISLLRMYINSFEGDGSYKGGGRFDENKNKTTDDEKTVYYKVYDAEDEVHTVGYGVNMEANAAAFKDAGIDVSTVQYGDFIDKKIVDKIQEGIIQGRVDNVKAATSGIELEEYQIHALVSHTYLSYSLGNFVDLYNSYWNQETDDKFEELYEKYSETPEMASTIMGEIDFENSLFKEWFYYYNGSHDGGGQYPGWVTRQRSEFTLFQGGYYSTLKRFWGSSDGIPGGYVLVNGNEIDKAACLDLQVWFEDNLFSGRVHCDTDVTSGAAITMTNNPNSDGYGYLNPEYSQFFRTSYVYQCPWWSYARGALYFNIVGRDDLAQVLKNASYTGDGRGAAEAAATHLKITDKINRSIDGIKPYSIISFDKTGSKSGHTAFVEAVTDDSIIVSDCGSGIEWYGVHIVSKSTLTNPNSSYYFTHSICLADAL